MCPLKVVTQVGLFIIQAIGAADTRLVERTMIRLCVTGSTQSKPGQLQGSTCITNLLATDDKGRTNGQQADFIIGEFKNDWVVWHRHAIPLLRSLHIAPWSQIALHLVRKFQIVGKQLSEPHSDLDNAFQSLADPSCQT